MLVASLPSIQRVFPPLLPPDTPPLTSPQRHTPRLLVAGVVTTVLAAVAGLAVLLVLIAQPTHGDDDRPRPAARQADAGAAGLVVETSGLSRILEERPTDGRLHGLTRRVDVVAYGYTDRLRMSQPGRPNGETLAAADGEHWLVVEIESDDQLGAFAVATPTGLSMAVDGVSTPVPLDGSGLAAFSVPMDAEAVDLVASDQNLTQSWSFVTERRSESAPRALYRSADSRVAMIDGSYSLPYSSTSPLDMPPADFGELGTVPGIDLSSDFGERNLTVQVSQAHLAYAVGVTSGDSTTSYHTASGPDRALLYLSGVRLDWGGGDVHDGYSIKPEDAVLALEDGSTVAPTPFESESLPTGVVFDPDEMGDLGDANGTHLGIFDGALVWDVPADTLRATLTIRPSPGTTPIMEDLIDFQGGSFQVQIVFPGG